MMCMKVTEDVIMIVVGKLFHAHYSHKLKED